MQEILMVATLAVFNVCWGVMASLPVRTIILKFLSLVDFCLSFVIKVFRHPCSQSRPLEKVQRAPKSAQVSLKRMTKRISTSSGHNVPRPLLHILSCPNLGQQVGARILYVCKLFPGLVFTPSSWLDSLWPQAQRFSLAQSPSSQTSACFSSPPTWSGSSRG